VAQRLVRRLCQNCKIEVPATADMQKIVVKSLEAIPDGVLFPGIDRANLKYLQRPRLRQMRQYGLCRPAVDLRSDRE